MYYMQRMTENTAWEYFWTNNNVHLLGQHSKTTGHLLG